MNRKQKKQRIRAKQEETERANRRGAETQRTETPKSDYERDTQRCARAMNRLRQHRELCKREKIKIRPAGLRNVYSRIAPSQMVWRRVSGMTLPIEPFMDAAERKEGLGRLMKWLEKAVLNRRDAEAQRTALKIENCKMKISNCKNAEDGGWPGPSGRAPEAQEAAVETHSNQSASHSPDSADSGCQVHPSPYSGPQGERENNSGASRLGRQDAGGTAGGTPALRGWPGPSGWAPEAQEAAVETHSNQSASHSPDSADSGASCRSATRPALRLGRATQRDDRLVLSDWNSELSSWQRVKCDGFSIEAICAQLGISRWKLTQLTKEYCNLTAIELFDGWKVRQLKTFMLARLREAAQQLWKHPGEYAYYKAQGYLDCQNPLPGHGASMHGRRDAGDTAGRMPALQLRERKRSKFFPSTPRDLFVEEKWEEKERRTTALIEKMWEDFDFESWALSAGYSSVRRLKHAVMTVLGKTFERLEKCLAGEIIEYYQCAEERELRNIALREDDCDAILDARRLYHKSEERPAEPFLDMWSAYEFAARDWLERMAGAFG